MTLPAIAGVLPLSSTTRSFIASILRGVIGGLRSGICVICGSSISSIGPMMPWSCSCSRSSACLLVVATTSAVDDSAIVTTIEGCLFFNLRVFLLQNSLYQIFSSASQDGPSTIGEPISTTVGTLQRMFTETFAQQETWTDFEFEDVCDWNRPIGVICRIDKSFAG